MSNPNGDPAAVDPIPFGSDGGAEGGLATGVPWLYYPSMPTATEQVLAVRATWDDDAKVWVAESDDVPGLATEAASLDALMAKLRDLIPELLELNESELPREIPFELLARERDQDV